MDPSNFFKQSDKVNMYQVCTRIPYDQTSEAGVKIPKAKDSGLIHLTGNIPEINMLLVVYFSLFCSQIFYKND